METIAILFAQRSITGHILARDAKVTGLRGPAGAKIEGNRFHLPKGGRLELRLSGLRLEPGAFPSLIQVDSTDAPFTFFARDVSSESPIWLSEYRVAVVPGKDARNYRQVAAAIQQRHLRSDFDRFEHEHEESYKSAARSNRQQISPIWLGVGRDPRIFRVHYRETYGFWGEIQAAMHSYKRVLPGLKGYGAQPGNIPEGCIFQFVIGQGSSCKVDITRHLEDGVLPILRSTQREQDIRYDITAFASPETGPLHAGYNVEGVDWLTAFACTSGNMLPPKEGQNLRDKLEQKIRDKGREILCCLRVRAVNTGKVPRYAWFRSVNLSFTKHPDDVKVSEKFEAGIGSLAPLNVVFAAHRINGSPMPDSEMAVLIQPGGSVDYEIIIPHAPVPPERAAGLLALDFDAHLQGCKDFWNERLASAAEIRVPEEPIDRAVRAGLLHCDLVTLGHGDKGAVAPTIGWYAPIGTESAPILQYYDSVGWHDLAERGIQFFFERQREDGMIQNFAGYESETGPLLWTAGEHFRYTHDVAWVRRAAPNIRSAADFLLKWRSRNQTEKARKQDGYGLIDGKTADPDEFFHSFFLNAGAYLGLKRVAEMFKDVDPFYAAKLNRELPIYRDDIRFALNQALAKAPLIPTGNGSWAPLAPPFTEARGATTLFANGGRWYTHGAFASRGSLVGPLWLVIGELFDPHESATELLLKANAYPVTLENAALSQPYYSRHDYAHLRRGEIKAFLKTYYNQLTALHDRETGTFWEHYYHCGQHKTHEEAWFLMQTRWMLWLENGHELRLLEAIPRHWLRPGREINLSNVVSYFGRFSLSVRASACGAEQIEAKVALEPSGSAAPKSLRLRLPHPERRIARKCEGGVYHPGQEAVSITPVKQEHRVLLEF